MQWTPLYGNMREKHTRIPDWRLKHQDAVIRQEVGNNETSVLVNGLASVHLCQVSQDIAIQSMSVLLHEFDEVTFWWLG